MTKKQFHQHINRSFYTWVNKVYPQYELDFGETGGVVLLVPKETMGEVNNIITYHQSSHYCLEYNYCSPITRTITNEMNVWLEEFITNTNLVG